MKIIRKFLQIILQNIWFHRLFCLPEINIIFFGKILKIIFLIRIRLIFKKYNKLIFYRNTSQYFLSPTLFRFVNFLAMFATFVRFYIFIFVLITWEYNKTFSWFLCAFWLIRESNTFSSRLITIWYLVWVCSSWALHNRLTISKTRSK
jgi:hypothetical protein